ncbi:hypothetical protein [Kitasatospora sp. NPDC086791]|uniref:hypothetical protein n=1 Tax=Kitasatospora sp. NPDC086791 TaxID=3155178 RepID=UPI00344A263A
MSSDARTTAGGHPRPSLRTLRLEEEAAQPTVEEVLTTARANLSSGVSMADILAAQREGRAE